MLQLLNLYPNPRPSDRSLQCSLLNGSLPAAVVLHCRVSQFPAEFSRTAHA
jgi:hypothetical protein